MKTPDVKMRTKRSMVVSLIGRPNVGKSTLFNRIMKKANSSITHDLPGVTRDRHYGIATMDELPEEQETDIILVDTGGFYPEKVEVDERVKRKNNYEPFFNIMADHAKLAIEESDLVLFIVDVREGLMPFDKDICDYIRTTKKKFWMIVNKFDSDKQWGEEGDFYKLGVKEEDLFIVSAEHGRGMGEIRERIHEEAIHFMNKNEETEEIQKGVKPNFDVVANVAIIGAPNVGKSTLLNRLVGSQRALVSNIAGTTVDPIEGYIDLDFRKRADELKALENEFRTNDLNLLEQYKTYLTEFELQEGLIIDDQLGEELMDMEDDLEMLERFEGEEDEQVFVFETGTDEQDDEDLISVEDMEMNLSDIESEEDSAQPTQLEEDEWVEDNPYRSIKLVDTAGIRKSKLVKGYIEEQSVFRSLKAITESDIVIFMVDATKGMLHQDRRLIDIALDKGKSVIVALNKIDLVPEVFTDDKNRREWLLDLRAKVPWLEFCNMVTISAKKGSHVKKLIKEIQRTIFVRHKKVPTGALNQLVTFMVDRHPIYVKDRDRRLKIKYSSMIKSSPPTFLMFSNRSKGIPPQYRRYLSKGIRREFDLINTPVHLIFRTRSDIAKRLKRSQVQQLEKN